MPWCLAIGTCRIVHHCHDATFGDGRSRSLSSAGPERRKDRCWQTPRNTSSERGGGLGHGRIHVFNLESARAVINAGEESAAPLLVQTSEGAVKHVGLENMVAIVRQLAGRTKTPVALHLDHGKSEGLARAAVDAGYSSVMIDASRESFDENVRETRNLVAYAHARGVHVEAELGTLAGIEDLGEQSAGSMLTDPDQAVRFAVDTEVDALAVAIATSHGAYKFNGEPRLDFERLPWAK